MSVEPQHSDDDSTDDEPLYEAKMIDGTEHFNTDDHHVARTEKETLPNYVFLNQSKPDAVEASIRFDEVSYDPKAGSVLDECLKFYCKGTKTGTIKAESMTVGLKTLLLEEFVDG